MNPGGIQWIIEEIEALSDIWELDLRHSFPLVGEGKLVLIKGGTISPHTSEDEEGFVDGLDLIFFVVLFVSLHHVVKCFLLTEIVVKVINNCAKSADFFKKIK